MRIGRPILTLRDLLGSVETFCRPSAERADTTFRRLRMLILRVKEAAHAKFGIGDAVLLFRALSESVVKKNRIFDHNFMVAAFQDVH